LKRKQQHTFYFPFKGILLLLALAFLTNCSNHKIEQVERAFYYWKSNRYLSESEKALCDSLSVNKLYIKFFEVNYTKERGSFPEAKTNWWGRYSESKDTQTVVPTVYLRNAVFLYSTKPELDMLADNVNFLITKYFNERFATNILMNEFQMDCDWTPKSKENYFYFLKKLKAISAKQISCTLRLYPYKYADKMGVPPVDKATLMCYNLLSPLDQPNKNSILDLEELESYLKVKDKYPLHLDLALPVYSWQQVYQNERFTELLYTNMEQLEPIVDKEKPFWYRVTKDTLINNVYLRVGDKLKYEETTAKTIKEAIDLLKKHVTFDTQTTVSLFHLDKEQLSNYSHEELRSFYTDFSK